MNELAQTTRCLPAWVHEMYHEGLANLELVQPSAAPVSRKHA